MYWTLADWTTDNKDDAIRRREWQWVMRKSCGTCGEAVRFPLKPTRRATMPLLAIVDMKEGFELLAKDSGHVGVGVTVVRRNRESLGRDRG